MRYIAMAILMGDDMVHYYPALRTSVTIEQITFLSDEKPPKDKRMTQNSLTFRELGASTSFMTANFFTFNYTRITCQ